MKTAAMLAVVAIIAAIAVAGLAVASGSVASALGTQSQNDAGRGMMDNHGDCGGFDGSGAQNQYRQDGGGCPRTCPMAYDYEHDYSWDWNYSRSGHCMS